VLPYRFVGGGQVQAERQLQRRFGRHGLPDRQACVRRRAIGYIRDRRDSELERRPVEQPCDRVGDPCARRHLEHQPRFAAQPELHRARIRRCLRAVDGIRVRWSGRVRRCRRRVLLRGLRARRRRIEEGLFEDRLRREPQDEQRWLRRIINNQSRTLRVGRIEAKIDPNDFKVEEIIWPQHRDLDLRRRVGQLNSSRGRAMLHETYLSREPRSHHLGPLRRALSTPMRDGATYLLVDAFIRVLMMPPAVSMVVRV
jgi:hypothetical protein